MHTLTIDESLTRVLNILLVEDSPVTSKLVSELLKKSPHTRLDKCVTRLADALNTAKDYDFDVILLDLSLEDSSGYATFVAIQRAFPEAAIVILSSSQDEELATAIVRQGAQDYLVKGSFDRKLLARCIRYAYERKQSTEALRQSELTVRAIFENSLDATVIMDDSGVFLEANFAAEELFGQSRSHLLGKQLNDFAVEDITDHWDRFRQLGKIRARLHVKGKSEESDRLTDCCFVANILPDQHLAVFRDITEQERLEEQLHYSHKMEAIGRLAGGVAHDFNNLLAIIAGYTELLQKQLYGTPMLDKTDKILNTTQRAASVVNQLLAFGRKQVVLPKILKISNVVKDMAAMIQCLIGTDVHLIIDAQESVMPVKVDCGQMEQIIVNLTANARDAMPKGGTLLISVENVTTSRRDRDIPVGKYVLLSVSDNGIGMEPATREHLFEPYFTTKDSGHGLGLATVYGIIKQSGGYITVDSEAGTGTTFKLYFPAVEEGTSIEQPAQISSTELTGEGDEAILLVDDEDSLRHAIAEFLESCGFTVLQAMNGSEAIEIAKSYKGRISLLISDIVMPGLNGGELIERFKAAHPDAQVLLMSGYADDAMNRYGIKLKDVCFLQKPFKLQELVGKIRKLLGHSQHEISAQHHPASNNKTSYIV